MAYTHPLIEALLHSFQPVIGRDYEKYRNHVYRVFLNCLLLDNSTPNEEKYAVAAVFHDIGIWTDHTIDYLAPSIRRVSHYLEANGKQEYQEEYSHMIDWHHKTSRYAGPYAATVEVFRKADWIDVSLGLLNFGLDKKTLRTHRKNWPNKGFHWFLVKKVGKNLLRHPLNPLPMFKR